MILSYLPESALVGMDESSEARTAVLPARSVPSLTAAPRLADPLLRRFLTAGTPLKFTKGAMHMSESPFVGTAITSWAKYFPVVHVVWLRARLVPASGSCLAGVSLTFCWFGGQETKPASAEDCLTFPTADVFVGGPPSVGALSPGFVTECDFSAGFSHRVKPEPDLVGCPRFYRHADPIPFGANTPDDSIVYRIYYEMLLDARLEASV